MKIHTFKNRIEILAPAKINWFLELRSKRADGFHEIETVMSNVSVYDHLRFTLRGPARSKLSIRFPNSGSRPGESDEIPTAERNLIIKAIELVRFTARSESTISETSTVCANGFDIVLQKNIPSAAGLGGASSDAAAALLAANRLWELNWPIEKLSQLAAQLGSDIPFFLYGGTAICRGRGEKVQPISTAAHIPIVIAKPPCALSTAKVFSTVKLEGESKSSEPFTHLISASGERLSRQSNRTHLGKRMFNRLQKFAEPLTDQLGQLSREFSRLNCLGHQMSGSGSSYFGVFSNPRVARIAAIRLSSRLPNVRIFCSHTI